MYQDWLDCETQSRKQGCLTLTPHSPYECPAPGLSGDGEERDTQYLIHTLVLNLLRRSVGYLPNGASLLQPPLTGIGTSRQPDASASGPH